MPVTASDPTPQREMEHTVAARILTAQGRLDEAAQLLQRLLGAAEAGGRTSSVIEILMLRALTLEAGGDTARATTALEEALTLAEPGGFICIFVDEGPPIARLLRAAAARGIMPEYVGRLLAAFGEKTKDNGRATMDRRSTASSVVGRASPALIEPLSERELEVLHLIAEGLTNPEIASRLFLALNTVKAHTRYIRGKLDVHSRTQAVALPQALGSLPRGPV